MGTSDFLIIQTGRGFMNSASRLVTTATLIAFGIIFPMMFHLLGISGHIFLPMHIPVLIAGFFLGGKAGFVVGVMTPILSSALTGMPQFMPMLPIMEVELATYGVAGGYLYKRRHINLRVSLLITMIIGRSAVMLAVYCMVAMLNIRIAPLDYLKGAFISGIPGIVIQMIVVPVLVKRLQDASD
jgi:uncharacterized membrane protein